MATKTKGTHAAAALFSKPRAHDLSSQSLPPGFGGLGLSIRMIRPQMSGLGFRV